MQELNSVFLDTSGLIATVVIDDQWHSAAEPIWFELIRRKSRLLTTSLVVNELGDALCSLLKRTLVVEFIDRLRDSPRVEIVHVTPVMQEAGWKIFRDHADKEWGITDCVSFAFMRQLNIRSAFTNDRHFEQAGFEKLIKGF
jgi:uncharacterized protein